MQGQMMILHDAAEHSDFMSLPGASKDSYFGSKAGEGLATLEANRACPNYGKSLWQLCEIPQGGARQVGRSLPDPPDICSALG
jgi:hypothetical protein